MDHAELKVERPIPFNTAHLDSLLDASGIDVLLATSKHNVQYLLGGYRFFFFDYMDAIGTSRYLPIVVYRPHRPEDAAYIGHRLEVHERELGKFWPPSVQVAASGSPDAMRLAVDHLKRRGIKAQKIGIESAFLPFDAAAALREQLGGIELTDAHLSLERLRARKSATELQYLRHASEAVVASMLAVFAACRPGLSKQELVERLRQEEVSRGLNFEYCLITAGTSLNRSPSDRRLEPGDIISLDSGGNYRGYIGDLCRMGILGEPDSELEDLLGFVDAVQRCAQAAIKPGAPGNDIYAAVTDVLSRSLHQPYMEFVAHGMGLISHEAPRLTTSGPIAYRGDDATRALESGMVISIETTMKHPRRGFVKLEDTVAVTESGSELFAGTGRGWNRAGQP